MVPGGLTGKRDLNGVYKKTNSSLVFSGEMKIPTLGSTVTVGNSASLVSHWNMWTLGLGFSYLHWTSMMDSIYLYLPDNPYTSQRVLHYFIRHLHFTEILNKCLSLCLIDESHLYDYCF